MDGEEERRSLLALPEAVGSGNEEDAVVRIPLEHVTLGEPIGKPGASGFALRAKYGDVDVCAKVHSPFSLENLDLLHAARLPVPGCGGPRAPVPAARLLAVVATCLCARRVYPACVYVQGYLDLNGPEMFRTVPGTPGHEVAVNEFEQEARILASMRHANIVALHGVCYDHEDHPAYLIMELATHGTLQSFLESRPDPLSPEMLLWLCVDVLEGLVYLHTKQPKPIIHRDLKSDNMLVFFDRSETRPVAKLCDMDCARPEKSRTMSTKGNSYAKAPEVPSGHFTAKSDMFGFGITIADIVVEYMECEGHPRLANPVAEYGLSGRLRMVAEAAARLKVLCPGLGDILVACTKEDPARRMSSSDALAAVRELLDYSADLEVVRSTNPVHINRVCEVMVKWAFVKEVQQHGCLTLCRLLRDEQLLRLAALTGETECLRLLYFALHQYGEAVEVCAPACKALEALVSEPSANATQFCSNGKLTSVLRAMETHRDDRSIQLAGCTILYKLADDNDSDFEGREEVRERIAAIIDDGALPLLQRAHRSFPSPQGKEALKKLRPRDDGCPCCAVM